jgi:hypothetical protein
MAQRLTRSLTCSYLYSDGTLLQTFDEKRNGTKVGETVDITYGYCKVYIYDNESSPRAVDVGRIVIHRYSDDAFVPLAKGGKVTAKLPNLQSGSERTRELGFKVQFVELTMKNGLSLSWSDIQGVLGSTFTVQSGSDLGKMSQDFKPGDRWGHDAVVNKVRDLRKKEETAA